MFLKLSRKAPWPRSFHTRWLAVLELVEGAYDQFESTPAYWAPKNYFKHLHSSLPCCDLNVTRAITSLLIDVRIDPVVKSYRFAAWKATPRVSCYSGWLYYNMICVRPASFLIVTVPHACSVVAPAELIGHLVIFCWFCFNQNGGVRPRFYPQCPYIGSFSMAVFE